MLSCLLNRRAPCAPGHSWVSCQRALHSDQLWSDGVRDYLKHVDELLSDYKDIVPTTAAASSAPSAFGGGKVAPGAFASDAPPALVPKIVTFGDPVVGTAAPDGARGQSFFGFAAAVAPSAAAADPNV